MPENPFKHQSCVEECASRNHSICGHDNEGVMYGVDCPACLWQQGPRQLHRRRVRERDGRMNRTADIICKVSIIASAIMAAVFLSNREAYEAAIMFQSMIFSEIVRRWD